MNGKYVALIELAVVASAALGFCVYQFWSLTRSIARDKASA